MSVVGCVLSCAMMGRGRIHDEGVEGEMLVLWHSQVHNWHPRVMARHVTPLPKWAPLVATS